MIESGICSPVDQDVTDAYVGAGEDDRDHGNRHADAKEGHESDRRARPLRQAGRGDVGRGGDHGRVAAEAGAQGQRPPVGVVAARAGFPLQLLDDRDHRRREGDVVDHRRAEGRDPGDPEELGGAIAAGDVLDAVGDVADRAGLLQGADHDEEREEEEQSRPLDVGEGLLERDPGHEQSDRGTGQRHRRRLDVERLVGEEGEDGQHQHRPRSPQLRRVADRGGGVQVHHRHAVLLLHLEAAAEDEVEQRDHHSEGDCHDRSQVGDEGVETEPGGAGDDDVRRVPDQGRGAADVGGDHLDDQQRHRLDVERVGEQEGDRRDQQDRRQVVEEGREQRRDAREAHRHGERAATGDLAGADRDVVVDARLLGQVDEDHHPRQQADGVEVDRLDRLLLGEVADEEDDDCRAEQGDVGAVQLLGRDDGEGDQEGGDGDGHFRRSVVAAAPAARR
jgi:hypothetical protein